MLFIIGKCKILPYKNYFLESQKQFTQSVASNITTMKEQVHNATEAASQATTIAQEAVTAANKTALTYIKVGTKDYAYIVIGAPKTSDDSHAENWTVSKLHGTSGVIYDTALKTVSEGGSTYTVKNAEKSTTATKAKVNFGVKLVNDGAESNKNYYAVVVVELTKNS